MPAFYRAAAACSYWYGENSDEPVPTYEKFRQDFKDYYFDGTRLEKGQAFAIMVDGRVVGEINYEIEEEGWAEIDILLYSDADRGRGYGPDALTALSDWLFEDRGVSTCRLHHIAGNPRAIRASEKAGFAKVQTHEENNFLWVRMEKAG